jgi:6-phosphogluconolactonase/glucosamine-6-phosphate isomerase/deaminase
LNQSAETIDFGTYSTLSPISAGLNNRDFRFSELVSADIELQIAGNGQATRGHIVALEPNSRQNRQRIKSALSNLQFRPRIVEDKHVPIPSARIRIEMPAAP